MINARRFLGKIERYISRIEGCVRLYARVSAMNASNDRRRVEGQEPLYDRHSFYSAMEEEVPRRML